MKKTKKQQEGFTFVEALVGMSITAVVLVGVIASQVGTYKATEKNKDIIFAQNKATQMIEELRSVVRKGESDLNSLDTYDNKNDVSPVLTTDTLQGATPDLQAGSQLSANKPGLSGKWKFVRQVKIRKSPDSPKSRTVSVSVYYADADGKAINPPLATLSTVLSTAFGGNLPTQVIDSYGIALSNQPGWWSSIAKLKQTIQDASYDLKVKNPGLDYRFHFITKSSFGRDPYYTPYINKTLQTEADSNLKFPYYYNGSVNDTSVTPSVSTYYYNPNEMVSDGMRINVDNATIYNSWYGVQGVGSTNTVGGTGTETISNSLVYSVADEFNTAVRGPEDEAINEKIKQTYIKQNTPDKYEPTYRKLIDDMFASDVDNTHPIHRNLMITNLHGELFPTIPLRNYSDAAKDPAGTEQAHGFGTGADVGKLVETTTVSSKYKRVVTHPEQLEYALDSSYDRKVYLRVYPYLSDPKQTGSNFSKIDTTSIFIPTKNFVGSSSTSTENQKMDNMSNFVIPTGKETELKNNIKIQYIDDDFVKRTDNYVGYVKINNSKKNGNSTVSTFYPIGAMFSINGYKFKIVAKGNAGSENYSANASITNANTASPDTYKIVSCDLDQPSTITTPIGLSNFSSQSGVDINTYNAPNTTGNTWKVDLANASIQPVYEGSYEIIVNPAFDRMGTGHKQIVPGILIKLHGTGTRNTTKDSTAYVAGGIPAAYRLYGLDYIPAPLGDAMRDISGALPSKPYPIKDQLQMTDSFLDTTGGDLTGFYDQTSSPITPNPYGPYYGSYTPYGINYGAYTGLKGKDLDSWGSNPKNTARWIISLNVGHLGDSSVLNGFQNKMMAIETRIGSNLNTGMTMNQSPNPYDGTVNQVAFVAEDPPHLILADYLKINPLSGSQTNGLYDCVNGLGDCGASNDASSMSADTGILSDSNKNDLSNLSRTYVWIGDPSLTGMKETEKYQMTGDIRHNPYIDVLENNRANNNFNIATDTSGSASSLNATNYPLLDKVTSTATFSQVRSTLDITRFFELFKKSLLRTNSIYNSLMGFSFYYYGVGGEVGSNSKSINFTVKGIPYNKSGAGTIGEKSTDLYNEILSVSPFVGPQIIGSNDKSWGSIPWIGELYPDDRFGSYSTSNATTGWANLGNLPSATTGLPNSSGSNYARYTYGTQFKNLSPDLMTPFPYVADLPIKRLAENGSKMFFHGSADGATGSFKSYFTDSPSMTTGTITGTGKELVANYGLIMPDTIDVPRGFNFTGDEPTSPLWSMYKPSGRNPQYSMLKLLGDTGPTTTFSAQSTAAFYDAGNTTNADKAGSAPIMIDASGWKQTGRNKGYVIINGLNTQGVESGTIIGRYSLMSMLHTFFRTGNMNSSTDQAVLDNRSIMVERTLLQDNTNVPIPPTVPVTPRDGTEVKPSDYPGGIPIAWRTSWKKWDGTAYSQDYPALWKELNITVKYIIMVSLNNGKNWYYLQNDGAVSTTEAIPGVYDINKTPAYVLATIAPSQFISSANGEITTDNIKMDVAPYGGKDILFRVEGHRFDNNGNLIPTNYSYQQRTVTVNGL